MVERFLNKFTSEKQKIWLKNAESDNKNYCDAINVYDRETLSRAVALEPL